MAAIRETRVSISFTTFEALATFAAKGVYIHLSDRVILGDGINSITIHVAVPYGCKRVEYHELIMKRAFSVGVHTVNRIDFDPYGEIDDDQSGGISKERGNEIRMAELDKQVNEK